MKLLKLLIIFLFSISLNAQSEQEIINDAITNDNSILTDTQSVIDLITPSDTTFGDSIVAVLDSITGDTLSFDTFNIVIAIDTIAGDTSHKAQYRLSINVGGFGTVVPLTWRDSADHIAFVNGITANAYQNTYKTLLKELDLTQFAREVKRKLSVEYTAWAKDQVAAGLNGDYTMKRRDSLGNVQTIDVSIAGNKGQRLNEDTAVPIFVVNAGDKLASIRYLTASDLELEIIYEDTGEKTVLVKSKGTKKVTWTGWGNDQSTGNDKITKLTAK